MPSRVRGSLARTLIQALQSSRASLSTPTSPETYILIDRSDQKAVCQRRSLKNYRCLFTRDNALARRHHAIWKSPCRELRHSALVTVKTEFVTKKANKRQAVLDRSGTRACIPSPLIFEREPFLLPTLS